MAEDPQPDDRNRLPFSMGPGMNSSPTGRFGGPVPQNGPLDRTALAVRGALLAVLVLIVVVLVVVF